MRGRFCALLALVFLLTACGGGVSSGGSGSGSSGGAPTWQEQYDLGLRYLEEGDGPAAADAFSAAAGLDPGRAEAYTGRGQAYVLSGETEENLTAAQADFEAALDLDGASAEAWLGLADVSIRRGDYDGALSALKEGQRTTGNDQAVADKIKEMEAGDITDSAGNPRQTSRWDSAGALIGRQEFSYDKAGRLLSTALYDGSGNPVDRGEYEYDGNGDRTLSFNWDGESGQLTRVENEYDGGRLVKAAARDKSGALLGSSAFQYDGEGRQVREDRYGADGTLLSYLVYGYDDQGNRSREERYEQDQDAAGGFLLASVFEWKYEGGRLAEYIEYIADETMPSYMVYHYDDNGDFVSLDVYGTDGSMISSTFWE